MAKKHPRWWLDAILKFGKLEDVARKYHVMATLPNTGVEKNNGMPFWSTTRPTYTKPRSYG